jgi:hypothetical protein
MAQSFDADFPALPRSTSASASTSDSTSASASASASALASASSSSTTSTAGMNLDPMPTNTQQSQNTTQNDVPFLFNFASNMATNTASTPSGIIVSGLPPRSNVSRPRSDDGQQRCSESTSDVYGRTLAQIQDQLDSVRALLNGNLAHGTRSNLISATTNFDSERAALEEEFREIMEDDDTVEDFLASSLWARHRAIMVNSDRVRKLAFTMRDMSTMAANAATRETEKNCNTATFLYSIGPSATGSDVWPDIRDPAKTPARYVPVASPSALRITTRPMNPATKINKWDKEEEGKSTRLVWPMKGLPSEIYYLIVERLSRDDIKAMRLTCKEFERHLSCILFKTVVVPFNMEIYGMLQGLSLARVDAKGKDKGNAKAAVPEFWKNSKDEDIYTGHGVDVFRSFGPRMKRFGMSFEVDEDVLANPPLKSTREDHKTYWGCYQWPYPEYKRFDAVAGLEDAADETPKMKEAFECLTEVQELALSLDAGLGWLSGPDRSIRSRVLGDRRPVFGTKHRIPERKEEARQCLWQYLEDWASAHQNVELKHCTVAAQKFTESPEEYATYQDKLFVNMEPAMPFIDLHGFIDPIAKIVSPPIMGFDTLGQAARYIDQIMSTTSTADSMVRDRCFEGGMFVVKEDTIDPERLEAYPIIPCELSKLQKEWLLETEWAQRAFFSSWLIAIVDNRYTFQHVHTLNFSRLSSRFLLSLCREDFWRALPQLENVTLNIIPDCRDVLKDNAGFVECPRVQPISAVWLLHKLIAEMISLRSSVKSLSVGWASGGEHAQGLTARNKHLMPAAILPPEWLGSTENLVDKRLLEKRMLRFPHLKALTLNNCWISPHALMFLVHEHLGLEILCLESVSLIAEPTIANGGNPIHVIAMAQHLQGGPLLPPHGAPQPTTFNQPVPNFHTVHHLAPAAQVHNPNSQAAVQHLNGNDSTSDWLSPRSESWPHVLQQISPGVTLAASGSTNGPINIPSSIPNHALRTLELNSCGYARLNNARLDESLVQPSQYGGGGQWFARRFAALNKLMMNTRGGVTAEIVQAIPTTEQQALTMGFDLTMGWSSDWADEIEGPMYDGCLAGGTGRFHGSIDAESRVTPTKE